jgi:hypothetical protein
MKTTVYQSAKNILKECAKQAKKQYKGDNPAICQYIKQTLDCIIKQGGLCESKQNRLANIACGLHPKK